MIDINKDDLGIGDLVVYSKYNKLFYGLIIGNTELFTVDNYFHDFDFNIILDGHIEHTQSKKLVCKVGLSTEFSKVVYNYMIKAYTDYKVKQEVKDIENKEFEKKLQRGDILSFGTSYYVYLGLCTSSLECNEYISSYDIFLSHKMILDKKSAYTYMSIEPKLKNTLLNKGVLDINDFKLYFDLFSLKKDSFVRYNKPTTKKKVYCGHVNVDIDKIENLEFEVHNSKYILKYIFNLDFGGK